MFAQAYADQIGKWCTDNNLLMTGHLIEEPTLVQQTYSIGDAMVNEGCSLVFSQAKPAKLTVYSTGHRTQISISGSTVSASTTAAACGIKVYRIIGINRKST